MNQLNLENARRSEKKPSKTNIALSYAYMLSRIKYLRHRYAISFCARTIFRFSVFLLLVFDFYLKKKTRPFKHIRIPEWLSDKWEFFGYLLTSFNKNDAMIQTAWSYGILFHSIQFEHTKRLVYIWLIGAREPLTLPLF